MHLGTLIGAGTGTPVTGSLSPMVALGPEPGDVAFVADGTGWFGGAGGPVPKKGLKGPE